MTVDFVVATPHDAVEFNDVYRNYTASAGYLVCNNIYNRVVLNEWYRTNAFPDLATHWECLDGARRWRFYLNQAARWQDGEPLTAHDVAYTHTHAMEKGYTGGGFLRGVTGIRVVDDHTVDYVLDSPNAGFLTLLGNFIFTHVLPRHLYEGTDWATNPHNLAPVGSGPFRFKEWIPGVQIVLEAVDHHWGSQPMVDRIIVKIVPDLDECVRMVTRGEAHFFPQDALTHDRLHLLEGADDIELVADRGPGMSLLDFNHRRPMWQDPRARKAVAHAINREEFRAITDPGVSEPWDHYLLGSVEWAFNEQATAPAHDPERARQLLAEAGLVRGPEDRLDLSLFFMETFHGQMALCEIMARQLSAVGIDVTPVALSSVDWSRTIQQQHDFDLIVLGGSMAPDPEITATKYSSRGWNNMGGHHNADADAAYEAARSVSDLRERGGHYRDLQAIWQRDTEFVPLVWYGTYFARPRTFFGWADQLDYSIPWWHWGRIRPVTPTDAR
jgi:peptide/nickel transport system substrate-binding protein